ncbi:hypothetical protein [Micromonospora avicenniae]|uniref:Uncharacterized protein n=1 Tax=Micromonospora avicenniae TaxID=1198245 RepID=A0A1N7EAT3_9ACTN|nr:hypothetical protein [Micromonospora avicenniae]SIR85211.1 hypothetical protein SAMN05444858_12223 [Micromonospora avicenniae]
MTYDLSPTASPYGQDSANGGGVREQARQVGSEAAHAGGVVAGTAREQGREVGRETVRQARDLYGEARTQLAAQAGEQQHRAAGGLRSLADEMRAMAEQGGQAGPVSELARQAADRVHGVAGWLESREPGDLITEVRDYARRSPGTFLVGAAVLGVLAGRLTRNLSAAGDTGQQDRSGYDDDPDRTAVLPTPQHVRQQAPPGGYVDPAPTGYPDPATTTSYADPPGGTGQPLPPPTRTDPLPGVPSSGAVRP